MKALRWHGRNDVRYEEVPAPPPPAIGEIVVDVEWCGICGTDVEEYRHGPIVIPEEPHPLTGCCAPITIGHEVVGRVGAAGADVSVPLGSRVALDGYLYCGHCRFCRRNEVTRCDRWAHVGLSYPGGLAEQVLVPASMALPAPEHVAADTLALTEPFAVAVRAVRRAGVDLGDRVAIIGGGTIGLAVLQLVLARGCVDTTLVEPLDTRRQLARSFGVDDVADSIDALLHGDLACTFDVVIDCTGAPGVPAAALPLARSGGRVVLVGLPPRPAEVDFAQIVLRELTVIGVVGHVYDEDTRTSVALISHGHVDPAPLITHRLGLRQAVADGLELLAGADRSTAIKVLVSPLAPVDEWGTKT